MNIAADSLIAVRNLSLGYGEKVVLNQINLDIPRVGVLGVMGPSGVGKSALVRTLTRQNDNFPSFWANGEVRMQGMNLLSCDASIVSELCPLLAQKSRLHVGTVLDNVVESVSPQLIPTDDSKRDWAKRAFGVLGLEGEYESLLDAPVATLSMAKHKQILMARLLANEPPCLFVDEPSPDVAVVEEEQLVALLKTLGQRMAVVLVTHNKQEARRVCDTICLVTDGRVVETTPNDVFFSSPQTKHGREFLGAGSFWPEVASPEATDETVCAVVTPPASTVQAQTPLLRDFYWAIPGLLGGMQQPGLLGNAEEDIAVLKNLGVQIVVNLTEKPLHTIELEAAGLLSIHFPIPDMGVPELFSCLNLCRRISTWIDQGHSTVLHCRAGMGRTGTIIACVLVYRGIGAIRAIEAIRKINPGYIQTDGQFAFVEEFARRCSGDESISIRREKDVSAF